MYSEVPNAFDMFPLMSIVLVINLDVLNFNKLEIFYKQK